jgi:FxsC-like protein
MGPSLRESAVGSAEGEDITFGSGFYFSYAHTPPLRGDRADPDYWVKRFFHELETEVRHLDHRLHGGFADHRIPAGLDPRQYAAQNLAECRVFVPLYSDNYFENDKCGREWAVFERRRRLRKARTGDDGRAIVPVLWTPSTREVPECARRVPAARLLETDLYLDLGLYQLIRLYEHEYHEAVLRLAQLIVHRARAEAPPAISPDAYADVEPAFPGHAEPQRPLYIAVAAAVRRTLPKDRDPEYYGGHPEQWRPYQPQVLEPLAERAARIAGTVGYQARISVLTTSSPETKMPGPQLDPQRPQGPSILLADPWVFDGFAASRTALERVDRCRRETVRLMVPWNSADAETSRQRLFLEARVQSTVPWMFHIWQRSLPERLQDLSTAEQFDEALLVVIDRARSYFLSTSEPLRNVPFNRYSSRPRLAPAPQEEPP